MPPLSNTKKRIGYWQGKSSPFLGKHHSKEARKKIGKKLKGIKRSEKWKKKLSIRSLRNKYSLGSHRKHSEESRRKISNSRKGLKRLKPLTEEQRKNISLAKRGNKNHFWRGGVTLEYKAIRNSLEYKLWRKSIFERDDYTCVWCRKRGVELQADHIKPFAFFPELRFAINNGRTLCISCHKTTNTYMGRAKKLWDNLHATPPKEL